MRSAVQYYGRLSPDLSATMDRIRGLLAVMEDNGEELWSCHAAARAFKVHLDLPYEVRDGFFASKGVCHAWLEFTAADGRTKMVLDILPMGAHGGPILADAGWYAPWGPLYIEDAGYHARKMDAFQLEADLFLAELRRIDRPVG